MLAYSVTDTLGDPHKSDLGYMLIGQCALTITLNLLGLVSADSHCLQLPIHTNSTRINRTPWAYPGKSNPEKMA